MIFTFGWNDAAFLGVSIVGIVGILFVASLHLANRQKHALTYIILLVVAVCAASVSLAIASDSFMALVTRSLIFQALSVYFLGDHTNDTKGSKHVSTNEKPDDQTTNN